MLHPFSPSLILIVAALCFLFPEAAADRDLQFSELTEVVDGYKYWGTGYCQDSAGNLYDFLRYDVSNTAAHGDISTPAGCEARCPKTIGFLGFSVQTSTAYYYNNYELTYCYCWFDDGDVPTGEGEDYVYTGNSGTGVVTQTSFSNYAFCYTPSSTTPPHSPNQPARYVKISIPGPSKTLHIIEVQVLDALGYNRAIGGIATQSSTYIDSGFSCSASYANDGDDTTNHWGKICEGLAWTQEEDDPWWQVDLMETFAITDVVIYNRYPQGTSKLSNARVTLLDASGSTTSEANVGSTADRFWIGLSIEDFIYVTDAPTASSAPTASNAPTPIPTLLTQPSPLPSSAPSEYPSLSSAPSDSLGPTKTPVIECSLSNPCPSESFCNYDYGEAGFCERCSDVFNDSDCYSEELTLTGAEECAKMCRDISPASYDFYLGTPLCNVIQSVCSTGTLTLGRSYMVTNAEGVGVESNSPNTLDGCPDGGVGQYEIDGSLDRIIVQSDDGYLMEGSNATITAKVFVWSSSQEFADFFYSSDAYQVNWQYIGTVVPSAEGFQDLSIAYEIPQGSNTQAIRVNFRWLQDISPCTTDSVYDDRDDLAFVVLQQSKYVRISLSGDAKTLSLAEVQVFDKTDTNQALSSLGANATQSSTYLWSGSTPCPATIAIDNITESDSIHTCDGVTQTFTETNPWLLVELANPTAITKVVLWNRMTCCMENLSSAKVELLDENMNFISQVADIGSMNGAQLVELSIHDFVAPASTKSPTSAPTVTLGLYEFYGSGLCSDADGYMFEGVSYQCDPWSMSLSTCSNYCEELSTLDYWNHHNGFSFRQGEMGADICICHYDSNTTIPTYDSYCWSKQESYTSPYVGSGVVASTYTDEGYSCYKSRCYPNCLSTPSPSYSPSISIQPTQNQPARYVKISIPGFSKTLHILEVFVLDADDINRAEGAYGEGGIATQSSTYIHLGYPCSASYANDGHAYPWREQICEGLAWTQEEDDPWWQVDLTETFAIRRVYIINRYHWGTSKLSNARVTLLDDSGSAIIEANVGSTTEVGVIELSIEDFIYVTDAPTVSNAPSTPSPTAQECLPNARKVRIAAKPGNYLQLFLVQVFSSFSGSCLATGKSASQSSTLEDSTPASNAIGGSNKYHFSHTALDDESPWWEIDLLENFDIQSVYIGQHMCKYAPVPIECFCHLSESSILLLDSSDAVIANYTFGKICAKRHVIDFNASSVYCEMPTVSEEP